MDKKEAELKTAQALMAEINKLQDDLYKSLKLFEKYKKSCTYYVYGGEIECRDNKKQPYCDPDYDTMLVEYNIDPLEHIPFIITWDGSGFAESGTTDLEFIYERIMDSCNTNGEIEDRFGDTEMTKALITEITSYVASIKYFGRTTMFHKNYFNMANIPRDQTVTGLETIFGNLFGTGPFEGLYASEVKSQLKLLENKYGSQKTLMKNGGIYIEELSYAPTKLDNDYINSKDKYLKAYAQVLEVLKSTENLQMCLSYIDTGDIDVSNNETSVLNNNIQAIANCVGETTDKIVEELANTNTVNPSDIHVHEDADVTTVYIIIGVIVVIFILLFIFAVFYFKKQMKKNQIEQYKMMMANNGMYY